MQVPLRRSKSSRPTIAAAVGAAATAVAAALLARFLRRRRLNWGATAEEAGGSLPGDDLIGAADVVATRVIEIDAPASAVWPWLVQMGPGRGGDAMCVEIVDPERTLAFRSGDGQQVWSFELRPTAGGQTRLLSRNRLDASGYGRGSWPAYAGMERGSLITERKLLRAIKELAEAQPLVGPAP